MRKKEKIQVGVFLVVSVATFFLFGLHHLAEFVNIDEHFWLEERIPQYWDAWSDWKLKKTRINDKPGVTVALVSGSGMIFEPDPEAHRVREDENLTQYDVVRTKPINFAFRLPILSLNAIFIFYFFWILKKITGNFRIALWSAALIATSPILIGISQIVNPDSLLWSFSAAALFSFLAYLQSEEKKFIFLTPLFLGLALLSKYAAVILITFFLAVGPLHFLYSWKNITDETAAKIKKITLFNFTTIAGAMAVFALLMPAAILKPAHLLFGTIGYPGIGLALWPLATLNGLLFLDARFSQGRYFSIVFQKAEILKKHFGRLVSGFLAVLFVFIIVNWAFGHPLINLDHIPFDARQRELFTGAPLHHKIILEFYPLVFSLSPLALAAMLFVWTRFVFKGGGHHKFLLISLTLFVLLFNLAMISSGLLTTIRYGIMVYPIVMVIAAIGLEEVFMLFRKTGKVAAVLTLLVAFSGIAANALAAPFFFNYTNSLLPKKYLITGAAGYGGYEAVQYLNNLPESGKLTVWADYHGVCEFFVGKCLTKHKFDRNQYPVDYYVLTRRGRIRYGFAAGEGADQKGIIDAYKYYDKPNPAWMLEIGGRPENYVKVFKAE